MFILFKGDLLDETQEAGIISKFAALFGVLPHEAAPFFKRHAVFFRNQLDSFTARIYYRRLAGIGAKAFLGHESSVAFEGHDATALQSMPLATCPICRTNQAFDKKCVICNGSDLKKIPMHQVNGTHSHPQRAASAFVRESASGSGQVRMPHEFKAHAERARKALWIGCLLMLVALVFDEFLTNYAMFEAVALWEKNTLDMGSIPYLIATLVITYGCLHYVRLKGYPAWFGLLGLTNLFGLGILILLPSRRQPQIAKPYLNATRIGSMLMVVFSLWWAAGFFWTQKDSGDFLNKPVPFFAGMHAPELNVYDSIPATEDALLEREEYLQAYINEAFDLLSMHEFDVDTTARIADGLYSAISNLSVWLYYQHFLYRIHARDIPLCFHQDEIEAKIRQYLIDVISRNEHLQNGIVARTHKDWTMFYAREDDPDLREINEFRIKLLTLVYKPIVFPWNPEERDKDIADRISNVLHDFDPAEELFDVEFQTDSRQIWILLKPDLVEPLAGKTICFGLWEKPGAVRWSQKKGSYRKTVTVFKRIGGDLPGKYLPPDVGNDLAKAALQIAAGDFDSQQ